MFIESNRWSDGRTATESAGSVFVIGLGLSVDRDPGGGGNGGATGTATTSRCNDGRGGPTLCPLTPSTPGLVDGAGTGNVAPLEFTLMIVVLNLF